MTSSYPSPSRIPLPPSPSSRRSSDHSISSRQSQTSERSTSSLRSLDPLSLSPTAPFRPRLDRNFTSSATIRLNPRLNDPFYEGSTISVNQPVGSLSISPSSRDVCLASRKGLYILDIANLHNAPRFIPQGGTWQIADCQWSPHPATSNLILSTSSQKSLVWDSSAQKCLSKSIDAHARAITDINWHARNPNLMATVSMDAGIRGWDLRAWNQPFMRVCAWGDAGTQVKWNRQHDHIVATAHNKVVHVWDERKGSVPVVTIKAHDSKIYGIDWDREHRHKLVTCSLDKTIKYWTIPGLAPANAAVHDEYHDTIQAPDKPVQTISTSYPVWRARNLPFGHGVSALPQRGANTLDMFGTQSSEPVETFEGHDNVVKEFVWRSRGGEDPNFEDREFQLITWSKDRTLRIWPMNNEIMERVGYRYGAPIKVLISRRGAADITYTCGPQTEETENVPLPVVNPSGIARQRSAKVETTMTRGGAVRAKGMDQLEWLTKVVKTKASPDSSAIPSRIGSSTRAPSRGSSIERVGEEWISLKDEVVLVNKIFPRPKIKFEKIDLLHRRMTLTMNGPWANGDRMAFLRIHWTFPQHYPYGPENPSFELERNPTISPMTREIIVKNLKAIRAENRQCLVATSGYSSGSQDRISRKMVEDESDSDDDSEAKLANANTAQSIRTCGATFGPNGQLVCFFPKQTVSPRIKQSSRSPSANRDFRADPLVRAMSALSRFNDPRKRNLMRMKPSLRRVGAVMPRLSQGQAGSTLTIHDVSSSGNPSAALAKVYGACLSPEQNLAKAFEAKRLDHAEVWAILRGSSCETPPPPYSPSPPADPDTEARREREAWERGMARKKIVVNTLFARLMENHDVQLLTLVSCISLDHVKHNPPPPRPETLTHRSPEQDYFASPRHSSFMSVNQLTPMRKMSRASTTPISPGPSSYRNSGWSSMLNASSVSLRGHMTPGSRSSFDVPRTTPIDPEDASPSGIVGLSIPVPSRKDSPRYKERMRMSGIVSASPTTMLPLKTPGSMASGASAVSASRLISTSGDEIKPSSDPTLVTRHGRSASQSTGVGAGASKVTFGSASPLRRNTSRTWMSTPAVINGSKKSAKICSVKMELPMDDTEPPESLDRDLRLSCEGWKSAYADFLSRCDSLGIRATSSQYNFVDRDTVDEVTRPASGDIQLPYKKQRWLDPQAEAYICLACAGRDEPCVACSQTPVKPICVYCRSPIRGLATSCARCAHRCHAKCFRAHFSATTTVSCPSCLCHCAVEGGTTGRSISYTTPGSTAPTQMITKGDAKGSITPLSPGATGSGRITYASSKTIREQDHSPEQETSASGSNPDGHATSGQGGEGSSGWSMWDPGRLAWPANLGGTDGDQRGREGRRRIGPFRVPGVGE